MAGGGTNKQKQKKRMEDFKKLRGELLREAEKLVSEDPSTKIAVLFTHPNSSETIHGFGSPSVNGVVKTFLQGSSSVPAPPVNAEGGSSQGFWWEDEKLLESDDPEVLKDACEELQKLMLAAQAQLKSKTGGSGKKKK